MRLIQKEAQRIASDCVTRRGAVVNPCGFCVLPWGHCVDLTGCMLLIHTFGKLACALVRRHRPLLRPSIPHHSAALGGCQRHGDCAAGCWDCSGGWC